eukprot:TRINITY_DN1042_c0_g1_i2.p2 TRINITY_DN1042_c0_g1~~TRINITY_DN1042_c0_g1_i2.p2  ORF type:complete len:109 (+),score=6.64 TRINITY_DN1042_c0_g1_i2:43-327(+)
MALAGAGVGIGLVFGSLISAVARISYSALVTMMHATNMKVTLNSCKITDHLGKTLATSQFALLFGELRIDSSVKIALRRHSHRVGDIMSASKLT